MKKIILASNNKHKVEEFKQMLTDYEILTMEEVGYYDDIVEDGETFLDNAIIKAKAVTKFLNEKGINATVVADDSGLCVNALGGAPGVHSARYAGDHNTEANRQKLLDELKDKQDRSAYFVTVLVEMQNDYSYNYYEGKTFGHITKEVLGNTGFAYDPLFYSDELGKTFGQASPEQKNSVSHRARAIQKLKEKRC